MKTKIIFLLAASGLALAACHNKQEEAPVGETNVTNMMVEPGNLMNVATEAPPATRIDNTAMAVPPSATLAADEQTQDDADATGMTARVNRDETGGNAAGQPAQ